MLLPVGTFPALPSAFGWPGRRGGKPPGPPAVRARPGGVSGCALAPEKSPSGSRAQKVTAVAKDSCLHPETVSKVSWILGSFQVLLET